MKWDLWRLCLNLCSLDLSLLFIMLVGRNFVMDIFKLKPK